MQQQPTQTGQWSIPGPPQYEFHPHPPIPPMPQLSAVPSRLRPYPPEVDMFLYQQYLHSIYGAPHLVPPPYHFNGYPPAFQGMGIPPCYPYAPPMVPYLYNQQLQQGPVQQTPAVPAEESAVEREVVDLTADDAPTGPPCYPYAPPSSYNQQLEQGPVQQTSAAAAEESAFEYGEYEVIDLTDNDAPAASPCYPYATPVVSSSHNQQLEQGLVQQTPVAAAEESAVKRGKRKAVNLNDDDAPVAPSYPSVPLTVQTSHNQQLEQGPRQQTPVVAAEESAVKLGKRKAVDNGGDTPPQKKQKIHPRICPTDFELVEYRGEARYKCRLPQCENVASVQQASLQDHINSNQHKRGRARFPSQECDEVVSYGDSNVGESCSKNLQEVVKVKVSQGPHEGATSNKPVGYVPNSLDETIDTAWVEEVLQHFETAAHPAPGDQLEEPVNSLDDTGWVADVLEFFNIATHSTPVEQLEEPANSLDNTIDTVWVAEVLQYFQIVAH
ncbi:hypothetical protein BDR07DRAFT_850127 [Suillus spraguei]|nr:hypothetical protein BDR07DRAFT_850127 [Suillus spraguei]